MGDGDWTMRCIGVLEDIERVDRDKSGTEPDYKLTLCVRADELSVDKDGVTLDGVVRFHVLERELYGIVGDEVATVTVGRRVAARGHGWGVRPRDVELDALSFIGEG